MKNNYLITILFLIWTVTSGYAQVSVQDPHKPLISKATATWCNVCGGDAWDNFHDLINIFDEDAVILAVHSDKESAFYSPTADSLANNFNDFFGVPSLYLGSEPAPFTLPWVNSAEEYISEFSSQERTTQASISFEIKNNDINVDLSIEFLQEQDDPHFYSVLLVENEVTGFQLNRGPGAIHSKILRTHLTPNVFNNPISEGPVDANQNFEFKLTNELEENWKKDNIEIVLVIWKKIGNNYQVVNSALTSTATEITSSQELNLNLHTFEIQPTILESNSQVILRTEKELPDARISLLDANGQIIQTIHKGLLSAGEHSFSINRSSISSSGIYFVSLGAGSSTISRRILVN